MRLLRVLAALSLLSAPALADADDDAALALFKAAFAQSCAGGFAEGGGLSEPPQRYATTMATSWGAPEPVTLWQFRCNAGAYNLFDVFLLKTEVDGLYPVTLARPVVEVENAVPDDTMSPVKAVTVSGWTADTAAINPQFDAATGRLSTFGLWRGLGDAYSAGTWVLRDGGFMLVTYEVDASYDEKSEPQLTLRFP